MDVKSKMLSKRAKAIKAYKAGVVYSKDRQTKTVKSIIHDRMRKAMLPGKRWAT